MFRLMLQKLVHKKWLVLCLLIGNILLVSVAVSHPMYKNAAFQKMLKDEFTTSLEANKQWPALVSLDFIQEKGESTETIKKGNEYFAQLPEKLGVSPYMEIVHYNIVESKAESLMKRDDASQKKIKIGTITGMQDHITMLSGDMYSDEINKDGEIEAVISIAGLVQQDLLVGETLEFENVLDKAGKPLKIKIVGVFTNSDDKDFFWQETPDSFISEIFISNKIFNDMFFAEDSKENNIHVSWKVLLDYNSIQTDQVNDIQAKTDEMLRKDYFHKLLTEPAYSPILSTYEAKAKRVEATLLILQVPVLMLLCAFLFMISGQMLTMEQNEISMMKSRGAKKGQIISLYLMQSIFLSAVSVVIGIPMGKFMCILLGSANAFMEFVKRRNLSVEITKDVWIYCLAAVLISIIMTVMPVIKYSDVSIVSLKQKRSRSVKPFWQKIFLDIILLGIAGYGYYSFSRQSGEVLENVVTGKSLNPLLYLSSSFFMLGAGLFFLRLQPWIIRILFLLGKRFWHPASYASFLQTIRAGGKQQFIMLFMILTVSLGIFNATVARTIIANAEENTNYITGADLIVQEVWKDNSSLRSLDPTIPLEYYEPDYEKYTNLPEVISSTKVLMADGYIKKVVSKSQITSQKKLSSLNRQEDHQQAVTVMGINTKEFGENTNLPDGLLAYDYHQYLNAISQYSDGILVSMNFLKKLDYRIGDKIDYYNAEDERITGTIYGFVDYWPGYTATVGSLNPDGTYAETDNYLIVAHIATLQSEWGSTPYQVWMTVKGKTDFFYDWVAAEGINITSYKDASSNLANIKRDTMFQGTNGILTMSFIIILLLCGVGYLIYWIMSIRSRDLLFGILRAMGMGKSEIFHMLINEQIFSGLFSICAGAGIGIVASRMFVPMIQTAYAADNQVLPLELITKTSDMVKLFGIIFLVLLVVLTVLAFIVSKMNITKALKLGED